MAKATVSQASVDEGTTRSFRCRVRWGICATAVVIAVLIGAILWPAADRKEANSERNSAFSSSITNAAGADADLYAELNIPEIDVEGVDHEVAAAIRRCCEAVIENPGDAERWGALGMTLLAHEFHHQARICFDEAAKRAPTLARWPYLRGRSMLLHDMRGAVPFLETAVSLCGNKPPAPRLTLCETLLELYELDAAESHLREFLKDNHTDPRARLAEARLLSMRGDYQACLTQLQALQRILAIDVHFKGRQQPYLLLMAEALRRLNRPEDAEKVRNVAMKHGEPAWPDEFMAEVARRKTGLKKYLVDADIYYGNGAYEKSISLLDPTVEKYPDSAWAKILLARALIRTGAPDSSATDRESRLDRAVHLLEAALKLEPQSVEAMFRLGVAKGYQGKIQEAAELYGRAAEAKPDFTMAHFNLANAHYQMGDRDAAIASLETVVAIQPDMVDARLQLGILLLQSGKYADAEKHLDFAARQQPENARIRKFLGQARQKMRP